MLLNHLESRLISEFTFSNVHIATSFGIQCLQEESNTSSGSVSLDITSSQPNQPAIIALYRSLSDAQMFYRVGSHCAEPLPADWADDIQVSLVNSAPMGCIADGADNNIWSFAYSVAQDEITMRYGVDEEHALFVVVLEIERIAAFSKLFIDESKLPLSQMMPKLTDWIARQNDGCAFPMSSRAVEPVFSTWYAYLQDVNASSLEHEAIRLSEIGCSSIFIDDGWQLFGKGRGYAGCGDWIPDQTKFPDMHRTVSLLRASGFSVVLWIAPLLLGNKSQIFNSLSQYAPIYDDGFGRNFHILDPRRKRVRDYITEVCARLVQDYGISGLKIDFLDQARRYQGRILEFPAEGDIADVGEAMRVLLLQIRNTLIKYCDETPIVEFRQPYSSPAIAPYSNIIRAGDCPADSITNKLRIVNERLIAGTRVVHGDMLLWDVTAGIQACAEQILASFFAVPQISVKPSLMTPKQFETCRFLLNIWKKNKNTILNGQLQSISAVHNYPIIHAFGDGGTQVSAVYEPNMIIDINVDSICAATILNVSHQDYVVLRLKSSHYKAESQFTLTGDVHDCTGNCIDHQVNFLQQHSYKQVVEGDDGYLLSIPMPHCGVLELSIDECKQ